MNAPSDAVSQTAAPPAETASTRPWYWSVRRELWENRSIYVAPVIIAIVLLFGYMISTAGMPHRRRAVLLQDESHQRAAIEAPYDASAGFLLMTAFIVGAFYCLDALYGERRERTILFWKSLPVSDRTTVLSKATIPLLVLPAVTFAMIVVTHIAMLLFGTLVLLGGGLSMAEMGPQFRYMLSPVVVAYAVAVVALWHAPVYGWLFIVSAWSKKAPFLWAVLPPVVIMIFEFVAFQTNHFAQLIGYRLGGFMTVAFVDRPKGAPHTDPLAALTPGRFLSSPGLWLGLLFAAAFLFIAIRMRRYREPL
jgi:ABC-2 type transport system permease protein